MQNYFALAFLLRGTNFIFRKNVAIPDSFLYLIFGISILQKCSTFANESKKKLTYYTTTMYKDNSFF